MMLIMPTWRTGVPLPPVPRVSPPNPLFVDTVEGTAAGTGSALSPVNSLAVAQALCAGLPDWVIKVRAPSSNPLRQEIVYQSTMDLVVEGVDDAPWHIYGSDLLSASWSGAGPIYSRSLGYTLLSQVVVTSLTEIIDGKAFHPKLLINTLTPMTPGRGEFGYAGGVLYVRLWDDSAASLHTFEIARRNTCVGTTGFGLLTVKNVVARHALVNCLHNGLFGQPRGTGHLAVVDSLVEYAVNGGVGAAGQNESTVCTRVESYRIANDAFNVHVLTGAGYMELNACKGKYSGDRAGQSAQGASCHENSHMVLNGGDYSWCVSGGMVAIESSRCDIHGDTEFGPVLMDRNMRLGNTPGPVATQASCAWLDASTGTVTGDVTVSNGQGVGVRATALVEGVGLISSLGNALPDVIAA
ncbi:hypothetical protein [Pseudomonas sp. Pse1]|uniref:hypothetical protein n=1 Tax=Pseudomonas sp. Pse1 TaxID=2926020 RepID=UPI002118D515|nr:hypothetical protein [Pseudomonas sp. Pse1]